MGDFIIILVLSNTLRERLGVDPGGLDLWHALLQEAQRFK